MLIVGEQMLHADGALAPGWVVVEGDRIARAGRGAQPTGLSSADDAVRAEILSPGFVDGHCHGGSGSAFSDADPGATMQTLRAQRQGGTTSVVASLVTGSLSDLRCQVESLADLVDSGELAGIHLEGPWLSPHFAGAHAPHLLLEPTPHDIQTLLDAGRGHLSMVTLAPELPGGMDAVRQLSEAGVVVAIGHTDADFDTTRRAADAGASMVTHLFNAMRPVHHRAPGPVVAALNDDRLLIELIADGHHVDPEVLALAARSARGGFSLVTDSMAAALAPPGRYRLGELEVEVGSDDLPRLLGSKQIAGSTLTMDRAVRTMTAAALPLSSILAAATLVPAAALGLTEVGRLSSGHRADLVLLSAGLKVQSVMRSGEWQPPVDRHPGP
ncbi:MAG: N-acetylglucosamine-6-phosphate deacetylase [Ornithinimicrobium sp.]|uniref:N-acetylglucosamine-6-phosphate deacetylase n=1 Tax=Ornithinimicrobium sp. TaxID=1977084 RepID=UPI003D9BB484